MLTLLVLICPVAIDMLIAIAKRQASLRPARNASRSFAVKS